MSRHKVDYDQLADGYDRRFEHDPSTNISQALREITQNAHDAQILEVGCGTGHWLAGLSGRVKAAYGVDLSWGMLSQARRVSPPIALIRAHALDLPFIAGRFDLIYCVNALHHFGDPQGYIQAAVRLLQPGGVMAVIGSDPHQPDYAWYVHDYFEGVRRTDLDRFPSLEQTRQWMIEAGVAAVQERMVKHIQEEKRGREVFNDPFLSKKATSQLALLSDEAYQNGMDRIRVDVDNAEANGEEIVFRTDLKIYMHWGRLEGSLRINQ